ncbi:SAM-dependent DNA methyltransferase [Methylocystis rosea]|uniref:SAM-dependent DNA methyltransferase n=1 Tax=Methylocystis rosea TaxID=173366 RepID=A0A3G8M1Y7_9HYPH|nr:SAM-dependent DNA methyltransferase [Methylocystis rosea]AZG75979.1 SAM-dependent DNA methyltransferase [Methylocystis rosea]
MTAVKGHSAVRAMKKPIKLSQGTVWENLELFPTPPWATRALFDIALPRADAELPTFAWDPCAGLGHMASPLSEYATVHASDVHIYELAQLPAEHDPREPEFRGAPLTTTSFGIDRVDFFDDEAVWPCRGGGWIIGNPPFVPAARMLAKALALDGVEGVALLLRLQWLTTEERWGEIYSKMPPSVVAPFVERVPMCLGGYDPDGSTATDYAWFIWSEPKRCKLLVRADPSFPLQHIPPCRARLTKREDRALALRCVPGFVPPSVLRKQSPRQEALALA